MQNTCPNPGCGAQYNLSAQHVGRQFACRKCGAMLHVDAEGLKMGEGAAPTSVAPGPLPPAAPPGPSYSFPRSEMAGQMLAHVRSDLFTWMFGAGAVLVIIFMFFPLLDTFHAARLKAKLDLEDMRQSRLDKAAAEKGGETVTNRGKERRKWEAEVRPGLQADGQEQALDATLNRWRDGWGMLLGFLLLGVASIAWLRPEQPRIRKVVGAVVICAEMLLIFILYSVGSFVQSMR